MDARTAGLTVVIAGALIVVLGLIIMSGALSWAGRLPGDLRYSSGGARVYVPITTMLILSVLLSVASFIARRWF